MVEMTEGVAAMAVEEVKAVVWASAAEEVVVGTEADEASRLLVVVSLAVQVVMVLEVV